METFTCVFELLNDICYMTDDYLLRKVYFDATWIMVWTIIRLLFAIATGWLTWKIWTERYNLGDVTYVGVMTALLCLCLFLSVPIGFQNSLDRFVLPEPYMYELIQEGVKEAIE